jgi:hypothetical protein
MTLKLLDRSSIRLCKLLDRSSIRLCISLSQSLLFVVIDIIHNCHVFLIISLSVQSLLFVVIDIIQIWEYCTAYFPYPRKLCALHALVHLR